MSPSENDRARKAGGGNGARGRVESVVLFGHLNELGVLGVRWRQLL